MEETHYKKPSPKTRSLHEQVAGRISLMIQEGSLPSGRKVPSLRQMSRRFNVSVPTVTQAYWLLENQGLLECRPQSGFYVKRADPLPPLEPPAALTRESSSVFTGDQRPNVSQVQAEMEKKLMFSNMPVLFLGIALLDPKMLPLPALRRAFAAGPKRMDMKSFGLNFPPGQESLRRQLARHYLDCGLSLSANDFMTTNGCTEALGLALKAVTQPGDLVAVESPTSAWPLLLLHNLKLKILEVPLHPQTGMDLGHLEKLLQQHPVKACLSVTSFTDPIGCLMPEANKRRLVEMLAAKDIPLIENDVFGDLHLGGHRPKPAKAFDSKGLVVLCSSFAKTLSSGIRVGWMTPGRFYPEVRAQKAAANLGCDPFLESTLGYLMERGTYKKHLRSLRKFLPGNLSAYQQAMSRHFPEGTRVSRPAGGLNLWIEFPRKVDAVKLCLKAVDRGVFVSPGPSFSTRGAFPNCIRIGYGLPFSPVIDRGLKTIGGLAKDQAEKA